MFTDALIVVLREWDVLITDVFTEDGIELVEGSRSVVICVPLDEEKRRLVVFPFAGEEVVKDKDVSVELES